MKKTIRVKTDDPDKPQFNLVIQGDVDAVAKISTQRLVLNGTAGEELESRVTITPGEKYPFSILGMTQRFNTKVRAGFARAPGDAPAWQVTVKALSMEPDELFEVITLKTDSPYKPEIKIRVYATVLAKHS